MAEAWPVEARLLRRAAEPARATLAAWAQSVAARIGRDAADPPSAEEATAAVSALMVLGMVAACECEARGDRARASRAEAALAETEQTVDALLRQIRRTEDPEAIREASRLEAHYRAARDRRGLAPAKHEGGKAT